MFHVDIVQADKIGLRILDLPLLLPSSAPSHTFDAPDGINERAAPYLVRLAQQQLYVHLLYQGCTLWLPWSGQTIYMVP